MAAFSLRHRDEASRKKLASVAGRASEFRPCLRIPIREKRLRMGGNPGTLVALVTLLVPFLEWHSQPPQCDSQPPQPLALRAPAPRASIAHSPNSWDLGYHLSVNVADAPCPWQQLAAKGYTVLSFAVGERDASAFLREVRSSRLPSTADWFHTATQHGPGEAHGARASRGRRRGCC